MQIQFEGFGRPLRNTVWTNENSPQLIQVRSLG
jgi:hypothetical protein